MIDALSNCWVISFWSGNNDDNNLNSLFSLFLLDFAASFVFDLLKSQMLKKSKIRNECGF